MLGHIMHAQNIGAFLRSAQVNLQRAGQAVLDFFRAVNIGNQTLARGTDQDRETQGFEAGDIVQDLYENQPDGCVMVMLLCIYIYIYVCVYLFAVSIY